MPDDKSAEQAEEQVHSDGEMSEAEQEALFNDIDPDEATRDEDDPEVDEGEEEEEDGEEEDPETDEEDDDDSEEDGDEDDEDGEDDEDEGDSDKPTSAAEQLKKLIAEKKGKQTQEQVDAEVERRLKEREQQIREEVRNEFVQAKEIEGPDGEKIDLDQMRETYGELFDAVQAISFQLATQMQQKALEKGQYVSREDFEAEKQARETERFISQLEKRHPDLDIADINDPDSDHDFWKWYDSQDEDTRGLLDPETVTVSTASLVLSAYKESKVKESNKKVDAVARKKKKKHTDLHGSTSRTERRTKSQSKKSQGAMTEQEQQRLFDEAPID